MPPCCVATVATVAVGVVVMVVVVAVVAVMMACIVVGLASFRFCCRLEHRCRFARKPIRCPPCASRLPLRFRGRFAAVLLQPNALVLRRLFLLLLASFLLLLAVAS